MKSREEIIRSKDYWLTIIQNKIYAELIEYMEMKNLNQKEVAQELNVSPSYISQVLNGNFNFTIGKLIDLSLHMGKAPVFEFEEFEELIVGESISGQKVVFHIGADYSTSTVILLDVDKVKMGYLPVNYGQLTFQKNISM